MRTKNEEQRDQLIHTVIGAASREHGAQGFTRDEAVARFAHVYKMPPVDRSVPRYEAKTPVPQCGVTVTTSGALYGQTADGTLVELVSAYVSVHRPGEDEPIYLRFVDDEPDDATLAARHAEVVDRVRAGTIRHDGTHLSLDEDTVRAQVQTFMEETLAAMIATGEAERLAAREEAAQAHAWAAKEAGQGDGSFMPCLFPALEARTYDAFDLDGDEETRWNVSLMAEDVADTYFETRRRREGC